MVATLRATRVGGGFETEFQQAWVFVNVLVHSSTESSTRELRSIPHTWGGSGDAWDACAAFRRVGIRLTLGIGRDNIRAEAMRTVIDLSQDESETIDLTKDESESEP